MAAGAGERERGGGAGGDERNEEQEEQEEKVGRACAQGRISNQGLRAQTDIFCLKAQKVLDLILTFRCRVEMTLSSEAAGILTPPGENSSDMPVDVLVTCDAGLRERAMELMHHLERLDRLQVLLLRTSRRLPDLPAQERDEKGSEKWRAKLASMVFLLLTCKEDRQREQREQGRQGQERGQGVKEEQEEQEGMQVEGVYRSLREIMSEAEDPGDSERRSLDEGDGEGVGGLPQASQELVGELYLPVHAPHQDEERESGGVAERLRLTSACSQAILVLLDEKGADKASDVCSKLMVCSWVLFLVVRSTVDVRDLVPSYGFLVASMATVLSSLSSSAIDSLKFPPLLESHDESLLGRLSEMMRASVEGVRRDQEIVQKVLRELKEAGSITFSGIFDVGSVEHLEENIVQLRCVYEARHPGLKEVDGMVFIEAPELIGSKEREQEGAGEGMEGQGGGGGGEEGTPSPPRSPARGEVYNTLHSHAPPFTPSRVLRPLQSRRAERSATAQTPMRGVMNNVRSLERYVRRERTEPDEELEALLEMFSPNPKLSIMKRVEDARRRLKFPEEEETIAVKLYYKSLREMLVAEQRRLTQEKFVANLNDSIGQDELHSPFLAICFELVRWR
eukprot:762475-Hanusia_phi.AAC.6